MKISVVIIFSLLLSSGYSQVLVRTITPVDVNTVQYPNLLGNTTSTQAYPGTVKLKDGSSVKGKITLFKKKGVFERVKVKTESDKVEIEAARISEVVLDPKIYEVKYPNDFKNPEKNFQPGYIILTNGEKLSGSVAQKRDFSDYDFFVYTIMFRPEGTEVASTISGGKLSEFGQTIDGTIRIWDGYADGYLLRMVDGRYRMSRNPYSKTQNEFFTSLKNHVGDSLAKQAAGKTLAKSLQSGSNINESVENAANAAASVTEVMGQLQINKKEYLIFDTRDNSVTSINKDSFKEITKKLGDACGMSTEGHSWDRMEDFVRALNASCK